MKSFLKGLIDKNNDIINSKLGCIEELKEENKELSQDIETDDNIVRNIKDVKLLVLTHGQIGSGFWDEVDMAFIRLQKFYGFELEIKRFGESGSQKQLEFLNEMIDSMSKNEKINYNVMCSTVLTPEIGNALRFIAKRIPTVTYNTSVSSIPDAIEYVGAGRVGERTQGNDLAIQMGLYLTKNVLNDSEFGFDSVKNDPNVNQRFIEKLSNMDNLILISHSDDVDNQAFLDRHEGVQKIFSKAIYYRKFEELKDKINKESNSDSIVLGFCLQESILGSLSEFLKEKNIKSILGVTDITSGTLKKLDEENSLVAVSGSPPINQGNLVSAVILNKVFGIFGNNVDELKLYTPIGNSQCNSSNIGSGVNFSLIFGFEDDSGPSFGFGDDEDDSGPGLGSGGSTNQNNYDFDSIINSNTYDELQNNMKNLLLSLFMDLNNVNGKNSEFIIPALIAQIFLKDDSLINKLFEQTLKINLIYEKFETFFNKNNFDGSNVILNNDIYSSSVKNKLTFNEWNLILSSGNIFNSLIFNNLDINNFNSTKNSIFQLLKEIDNLINEIKNDKKLQIIQNSLNINIFQFIIIDTVIAENGKTNSEFNDWVNIYQSKTTNWNTNTYKNIIYTYYFTYLLAKFAQQSDSENLKEIDFSTIYLQNLSTTTYFNL